MGLMSKIVDSQIESALSRVPLELNDMGYDKWGFNAESAKIYASLAKPIYRYFRPEIHGIENIPSGRVLVVPNHSGQLPFDGLVVEMAVLLEAEPPRLLRGMAERWFPTLPMINILFSRTGVVVGDPINCRNLMEAENGILVFPEGAAGCGKPFHKRYQLCPFGRGFMRLALQTNTPIVPVGVVGAEESIISIANLKPLSKLFGTPYFPVPALLPLLGPLAYLPLPTKFHIYFGEPMLFEGDFDDENEVIQRKVREVEDAVAALIARGREERESWWS